VSVLKRSKRLFLLCLGALSVSCSQRVDQYFERTALPDQVVPLYDEVAAFKARGGSKPDTKGVTKKLHLDLGFLVQDSKVRRAVIAPFDDANWYEPIEVTLEGTRATVELDLSRDFLVALDLGEPARNGYQAMAQLGAAGGLIPGALKPRLCQLILCSPESFPLTEIDKRLPEVNDLPFEIGNVLPPLPVGPVGRKGTVCDACFDRGPSIVPCFLYKWCGDFPIVRWVHVRRNIYSLSPAEITTLRAGVATMKARPQTDPTSWWYQAKMHALDSGTALALQDQCQHRQFLFFSWHRMFVYYFERILRAATGDASFAQPYWNYTDNPSQGPIPEPYRLPASATTNALYDPTRAAIYNGGAALPPSDVSYASGFNLTNFTSASAGVPSFGGLTVTGAQHFPSGGGSGQIERSPHNNVHNDISGDMAGGESPKDPVFWLHHSNIDRLWKRWLALGNGRANPTTDTVWMTHAFTFFDETGAQKTLTGAQVLNTVTQLGYRYDDDPYIDWPLVRLPLLMKEVKPWEPPEPIVSIKRPVALGRERVDVPVRVPGKDRSLLATSLAADPAHERIVLRLLDIRYDAPVGVTYLLFLNLPPDARNPDQTDPSFIGTLGFFGGSHHGAAMEAGLAEEYDITRVAHRLRLSGDLVVSAFPSLPVVPEGRKDLQALRDRLRPNGNPRFGEIVLQRSRVR